MINPGSRRKGEGKGCERKGDGGIGIGGREGGGGLAIPRGGRSAELDGKEGSEGFQVHSTWRILCTMTLLLELGRHRRSQFILIIIMIVCPDEEHVTHHQMNNFAENKEILERVEFVKRSGAAEGS